MRRLYDYQTWQTHLFFSFLPSFLPSFGPDAHLLLTLSRHTESCTHSVLLLLSSSLLLALRLHSQTFVSFFACSELLATALFPAGNVSVPCLSSKFLCVCGVTPLVGISWLAPASKRCSLPALSASVLSVCPPPLIGPTYPRCHPGPFDKWPSCHTKNK